MINLKKQIFKYESSYLLVFFVLYLSVLLGFYFNEDNLGGASNDAIHHFKIAKKFNEDFYFALYNFGNSHYDLGTRNSPIFWIVVSFLEKFLSYDTIRLLNSSILFFIAIIFYKCLKLNFKELDKLSIIFLSSFIFLSPSLRSLSIWPYSLSWGLLFFLISIYYYLKFKNNLNLKNSTFIIISIVFSSYIYPSFSVFYLYYMFKINEQNKNKLLIIKILFLSLILSLPCLLYLLKTDFLNHYQNAQGFEVSILQSINISNKILIISTLVIYLILPLINLSEIFYQIKKIKKINLLIVIIFSLINIYFFNFPNSVWGGGFFHKLSHIIFNNNNLFFVFAILSILIIYSLIKSNLNNLIIIILLILFNPQLTIYVKYFDPLVFILFLTLFKFNLKKHFLDNKYSLYQFYGVIIFYYIVIYSKKILI